MTRIDCVVLDFDGTLTDVEHHAPLYEEAFRQEIADRAGFSRDEIDQAWNEAVAFAHAQPELGWVYEGRVVAPAAADPYLFANAVAQRLLSAMPDDDARGALIYAAYRAAYSRIATRFRAEAPAVLDALTDGDHRVFVVTNANADDVAAKLDTLPLARRAAISVRGDARKFRIVGTAAPDARFEALPEDIRVRGLLRPILLKRGHYFDILNRIWGETGSTPESTLVCGDIFELDLALPSALGAHVQLATHARTLSHEREAALALARGGAENTLQALLPRIVRSES